MRGQHHGLAASSPGKTPGTHGVEGFPDDLWKRYISFRFRVLNLGFSSLLIFLVRYLCIVGDESVSMGPGGMTEEFGTNLSWDKLSTSDLTGTDLESNRGTIMKDRRL